MQHKTFIRDMTESRKECSYVKKSNAKKNILELQIAQICAGKNENYLIFYPIRNPHIPTST